MDSFFSIAWNANEIFALNPSYATEKRPSGRTPPFSNPENFLLFSKEINTVSILKRPISESAEL